MMSTCLIRLLLECEGCCVKDVCEEYKESKRGEQEEKKDMWMVDNKRMHMYDRLPLGSPRLELMRLMEERRIRNEQ